MFSKSLTASDAGLPAASGAGAPCIRRSSAVSLRVCALCGLGAIDASVTEVAKGMGMSRGQRLRKVELPLAAPVILAGVRTSVIINIGTATIASTVGASTLGTPIIIGLSGFNTAYVIQGALLVALAAIIADRLFERLVQALSQHAK